MTTVVDRAALSPQVAPPVTVAELVTAIRDQQPQAVPGAPQPVAPTMAVRVSVLAAHGGAGSSTVALALADELTHDVPAVGDAARSPVRLVDRAVPESSGLVAAAEREVASPYPGWRARQRGPVVIYALDPSCPSPSSDWVAFFEGEGHTIVDFGRPWPCEGLPCSDESTRTLVVCRATVPGVRRAELALAEIGGDVLLAAVGSRRWPGEVEATFGPRTRSVVEDGRCVLFPSHRRLERCGPDSSPFPRRITASASRLAGLLCPLTSEGALP
jgi:hypothetical protein